MPKDKRQAELLLYTPLREANLELERRRSDKILMQKVRNFFSTFPVPVQFSKHPRSVLPRYIITPNIELEHFLGLKGEINCKPLLLESAKTKFVARNFEKYSLCRLTFYRGVPPDGHVLQKTRIVNFNESEGVLLSDIKTESGEELVDFHHRILKQCRLADGIEIADFSDWFLESRRLSEKYYLYYLALFVAHGILFENFLLNKREEAFTARKVVPAFLHLIEMFGVRPLIVPVVPHAQAEEPYWCYYNEDVMRYIKSNI